MQTERDKTLNELCAAYHRASEQYKLGVITYTEMLRRQEELLNFIEGKKDDGSMPDNTK